MEQIQNEQGIVLNIYDQNDNHALIKVLTNKQILYLYAKGFYKPQSKNLSQVFIGSLVNFELFCNYGSETKKLLKKAQIDSFLDFEKISQQSYQNLIHFLNLLETHNSKFFNEYVKFLKTKNLDCVDWMITYLLNFVLETKGKKLILDRCFICKTKQNLYSVNVFDGGMFCINHHSPKSITNINLVKAFYYLSQSFNDYLNYCSSITNFLVLDELKILLNF